MNMVKYTGLDIHLASVGIVVLNATGKLVMEAVVEMRAEELLDFLEGLRGCLYVDVEEGTYDEWLSELLSPQAAEVMVATTPG